MPSAHSDQHPLLTAPPSPSRPRPCWYAHALPTPDHHPIGRLQSRHLGKTASNHAPSDLQGRRDRCRILRNFPIILLLPSRSVISWFLLKPSRAFTRSHPCSILRVSPIPLHITLHPSHASSPFLRLTRQPTGVERRRGCGCGCCRRRRRCNWCWSNFSPRHNLATRAHTTHLFWSLPPSLQRSCWSRPPPKQNPPSPGHPGSSQHCPLQISHSRLGTPALPVQPSSHLGSARDPRLVS